MSAKIPERLKEQLQLPDYLSVAARRFVIAANSADASITTAKFDPKTKGGWNFRSCFATLYVHAITARLDGRTVTVYSAWGDHAGGYVGEPLMADGQSRDMVWQRDKKLSGARAIAALVGGQ